MEKFLNKITNEVEEADNFTKLFAFSNNSNYEIYEELSSDDSDADGNLDDGTSQENQKKIKGKKTTNIQDKTE